MITAYKYLFYKLYTYAKKNEQNHGQSAMPEWIALFSISILLFINLDVIFSLFEYFFKIEIKLSTLAMILIALVVYLINYFIFIKGKIYIEIVNSFAQESRKQAISRTFLVWFYMISSFLLTYIILPNIL